MNDYNQVVAKAPKNFDAIYSIAALYYNKAAGKTAELTKLSDDYSPEAKKRYVEKRAEIYAQKEDLERSHEFKKQMYVVQGGGTNASFYFNE